jgi:hypothetical protein
MCNAYNADLATCTILVTIGDLTDDGEDNPAETNPNSLKRDDDERTFAMLSSVSGTPKYIHVKPKLENFVTVDAKTSDGSSGFYNSYSPGTSVTGSNNNLVIGTQTILASNVSFSISSFHFFESDLN